MLPRGSRALRCGRRRSSRGIPALLTLVPPPHTAKCDLINGGMKLAGDALISQLVVPSPLVIPKKAASSEKPFRYVHSVMHYLLSLLSFALLAPCVFAAPLLELKLVNGEVKTFSREELEALPQLAVVRKVADQPDRIYSGPSVESLFAKFEVPLGDNLKGDALKLVFLAAGADGHAVAMSVAEVDSSINDRKIIVAIKLDQATLPEGEGPLRLIVEKDLRPVRWVKSLLKLTLSELSSPK